MKLLILIAAVLALAAAKPSTYKETEDFQYSRSSSDDGTKSGFYGAQRGNMGGNYERAHNMDGLAQHQMSTAVKQVEGELGDAVNTRTGSVFTSANSRGIYGSGHYDLSNLKGRNFQDGVHSYDASQSHASLSSHHGYHGHQSASSLQSSGYNSDAYGSGYSGYHGSNNYGHSLQHGNLQAEQNTQDSNLQAEQNTKGIGYGQALSHSSGYHSASGYHSQSAYDSSSTSNQHNLHTGYVAQPQSRLIVATPVRIVGRPGQRVAVPVGVQTYDATHSASTIDQNAIDISAEVLNNADSITYRPTNNAKRYESSYSYRKQWEKHDVKPEVIALSVPTENPIPKHSELYDDSQVANNNYYANSYNSHSGYADTRHSNSHVQSSAAAQQQYQYAADSLHSNSASSRLNSDALTHGAYSSGHLADIQNSIRDSDTKPKSYQSSFSYHKAWERQGDPYVIKPADGSFVNQGSQRLSSASHSHLNNDGVLENCDESGHVRVARSYDIRDYMPHQLQSQELEESLDQQSGWELRNNIAKQRKWYTLDLLSEKPLQDQPLKGLIRYKNNSHKSLHSWDNSEQDYQSKRTGAQTSGKKIPEEIKWDNFQDLEPELQESHSLEKLNSNIIYEQGKKSGLAQHRFKIDTEELDPIKQSPWNRRKALVQQLPNAWTMENIDGVPLSRELYLNAQTTQNSGGKRGAMWLNYTTGKWITDTPVPKAIFTPSTKPVKKFNNINPKEQKHLEYNNNNTPPDTRGLGNIFQSSDDPNVDDELNISLDENMGNELKKFKDLYSFLELDRDDKYSLPSYFDDNDTMEEPVENYINQKYKIIK